MRFALIIVVAALALAGTAQAVEPGFRYSKQLTIRAAKMAPGAKVYCARGTTPWANAIAKHYPEGTPRAVAGFVLVENREIYLYPSICWSLENKLRGRYVTDSDFAFSLATLIHESAHAKGILDECAADKFALSKFTLVARRDFGITSYKRLRALRSYAFGAYC